MSEDKPGVASHTNGENGDRTGWYERAALSGQGPRKHTWSAGLLFVLAVYAASHLLYLARRSSGTGGTRTP